MRISSIPTPKKRVVKSQGVTLVEILIGLVIVVVASVGTLTYFAYGLGNVGKQGNRRAALERARERLEQLLASNVDQLPPQDGVRYCCAAATCIKASWTACPTDPVSVADTVLVEDQGALRRETSAQFVDDPSAGTTTRDIYRFSTTVWFTKNSGANDDFNRVYLRTLRTS